MIAAPAAAGAAASSFGLCSMCTMCCSAVTACLTACTWARTCVNCCSGGMWASKEKGGWSAGKIGSMMIMVNGVGLALLMQYGIGPHLRGRTYMRGECSKDGGGGYEHACLAQQGVFRVSLALVAFYLVCAVGCRMSRQFHEALWTLKFLVVFLPLTIAALAWIPAEIVEGFVWVARGGASLFVVLQMIVIVDLAYAVNDWFVAQSNTEYAQLAARYDSGGGGLSDFWNSTCGSLDEALGTLLGIALFLFAVALTGIILLFVYFSDCATTTAFVAMTLVLCVAATVVQLAVSENGNLLTSSAVCAYAVFIAYTAVSRDPRQKCNPFLEDRDVLGIVLGLGLTLTSLGWTTHASTASIADVLGDESGSATNDLSRELVPTGSSSRNDDDDDAEDPVTSSSSLPPAPLECLDGGDSENVRFNGVMCLVACYLACVLTNWGTWQNTVSDISNPLAGRVSSWLNIGAQWVMFLLYFWTLLAPLVFPDRDFS